MPESRLSRAIALIEEARREITATHTEEADEKLVEAHALLCEVEAESE